MAYGHPDAPRVPGAIVDGSRWREAQARAQKWRELYKPLPAAAFVRRIPPAMQAPAPKPRVTAPTVFCESCGSEAERIPPNLWQCRRPSCRKLWAAK